MENEPNHENKVSLEDVDIAEMDKIWTYCSKKFAENRIK